MSDAYELQNSSLELNGAEEGPFSPELSNGLNKDDWTFEEDFIIMMCGNFVCIRCFLYMKKHF